MSLNHIRPWRNIYRRKSRQIMVGNVPVGGDAPITVQTMTNTLTTDPSATIKQIIAAAEAGADIVRVSVPDPESAAAMKEICRESPVPIVADIHFHYKRGIEAAEAGAACLRINPGNIGDEKRIKEVIKAAKDNNCSIRIGVNAGSLEKELLEKYGEPCPDAMVESGLNHIKILQDNDFHEFKISCKASDVFMAAAAYQQLAEATDAPIHLGITEAGGLTTGTIKSAIETGFLKFACMVSRADKTFCNCSGWFTSQSFCGASRRRAPLAPPRLSEPRKVEAEAQAVETKCDIDRPVPMMAAFR